MKKRRTKWIVILLVVIVIAAVGSRLAFGGGSGMKYTEAIASTGTITTYYNFSGSIDVNHSVTITSPTETTVSEVYVKANATVAKNARLMRLADGTVLKADIAGEVTSIDVTADSAVRAGDTLAEIMDLTSMKVSFKVDEYDVSAIQLEKTAQITLDGSGNAFEGAVSSLDKHATQDGDLSYYIATIDLTGVTLPQDALPGMQVTVKLLNQSVQNVVRLPIDAVSFTAQNEPYVRMPEGNGTQNVAIQVGINDGDYVEITQGLKEGETVLYTPTSTRAATTFIGARRYAE